MNEVEDNDSNHNYQKSLLSDKYIKRVSLHWEESSYHIHLSFWRETSSRTRTFLLSLTFHLMKDTNPTPSIHSRIFFFSKTILYLTSKSWLCLYFADLTPSLIFRSIWSNRVVNERHFRLSIVSLSPYMKIRFWSTKLLQKHLHPSH